MGSPSLKSSVESVLSDLLHGDACMNSKTEILNGGNFDDFRASDDPVSLDAGHNAGACNDVAGITWGSTSTPVGLPHFEDSQDSILDIEGCSDDEVSLIGWGSQENDAQPVKESLTSCHSIGTAQAEEVSGCTFGWRSMVHEDDPFLSLIPCEIPRVVACLEKTNFDHLQAYQQLGFHVTGTGSRCDVWLIHFSMFAVRDFLSEHFSSLTSDFVRRILAQLVHHGSWPKSVGISP